MVRNAGLQQQLRSGLSRTQRVQQAERQRQFDVTQERATAKRGRLEAEAIAKINAQNLAEAQRVAKINREISEWKSAEKIFNKIKFGKSIRYDPSSRVGTKINKLFESERAARQAIAFAEQQKVSTTQIPQTKVQLELQKAKVPTKLDLSRLTKAQRTQALVDVGIATRLPSAPIPEKLKVRIPAIVKTGIPGAISKTIEFFRTTPSPQQVFARGLREKGIGEVLTTARQKLQPLREFEEAKSGFEMKIAGGVAAKVPKTIGTILSPLADVPIIKFKPPKVIQALIPKLPGLPEAPETPTIRVKDVTRFAELGARRLPVVGDILMAREQEFGREQQFKLSESRRDAGIKEMIKFSKEASAIKTPTVDKLTKLVEEHEKSGTSESRKESILKEYQSIISADPERYKRELRKVDEKRKLIEKFQGALGNIEGGGWKATTDKQGNITFKSTLLTVKQIKALRPGFQTKTVKEPITKFFFRKYKVGVQEAVTDIAEFGGAAFKPSLKPKTFVYSPAAKLTGKVVATGADLAFYFIPGVGVTKILAPTAETVLTGDIKQYAKEEPLEVGIAGVYGGIKIAKPIISYFTTPVGKPIAVGPVPKRQLSDIQVRFADPKGKAKVFVRLRADVPSRPFVRLTKFQRQFYRPTDFMRVRIGDKAYVSLTPKHKLPFFKEKFIPAKLTKPQTFFLESAKPLKVTKKGEVIFPREVQPLDVSRKGVARGVVQKFRVGVGGRKVSVQDIILTGRGKTVTIGTFPGKRPFEKALLKKAGKGVEQGKDVFVSLGTGKATTRPIVRFDYRTGKPITAKIIPKGLPRQAKVASVVKSKGKFGQFEVFRGKTAIKDTSRARPLLKVGKGKKWTPKIHYYTDQTFKDYPGIQGRVLEAKGFSVSKRAPVKALKLTKEGSTYVRSPVKSGQIWVHQKYKSIPLKELSIIHHEKVHRVIDITQLQRKIRRLPIEQQNKLLQTSQKYLMKKYDVVSPAQLNYRQDQYIREFLADKLKLKKGFDIIEATTLRPTGGEIIQQTVLSRGPKPQPFLKEALPKPAKTFQFYGDATRLRARLPPKAPQLDLFAVGQPKTQVETQLLQRWFKDVDVARQTQKLKVFKQAATADRISFGGISGAEAAALKTIPKLSPLPTFAVTPSRDVLLGAFGVASLTKEAVSVSPLVDVKTITETKVKALQVPKVTTETLEKQLVFPQTTTGTSQVVKQAIIQTPVVQTPVVTPTVTAITPAPTVHLPSIFPESTIPKLPATPLVFPEDAIIRNLGVKKRPGVKFTTEVRREGVFRKVNKPTTARKAVRKGIVVTRETLAATFRVVPNKKLPAGYKLPVRPNPKYYRQPKAPKKPHTYIERKNLRLKKPKEIREILAIRRGKTSRKVKFL